MARGKKEERDLLDKKGEGRRPRDEHPEVVGKMGAKMRAVKKSAHPW